MSTLAREIEAFFYPSGCRYTNRRGDLDWGDQDLHLLDAYYQGDDWTRDGEFERAALRRMIAKYGAQCRCVRCRGDSVGVERNAWTSIYFDPGEKVWVVAVFVAEPLNDGTGYHYPAVRCDRDTGPTRESVEPKAEAMLQAAKAGRYSNDAARTLGVIAP